MSVHFKDKTFMFAEYEANRCWNGVMEAAKELLDQTNPTHLERASRFLNIRKDFIIDQYKTYFIYIEGVPVQQEDSMIHDLYEKLTTKCCQVQRALCDKYNLTESDVNRDLFHFLPLKHLKAKMNEYDFMIFCGLCESDVKLGLESFEDEKRTFLLLHCSSYTAPIYISWLYELNPHHISIIPRSPFSYYVRIYIN